MWEKETHHAAVFIPSAAGLYPVQQGLAFGKTNAGREVRRWRSELLFTTGFCLDQSMVMRLLLKVLFKFNRNPSAVLCCIAHSRTVSFKALGYI